MKKGVIPSQCRYGDSPSFRILRAISNMNRLFESKVDDKLLAYFLLASGLVSIPQERKLLESGEIEPRFVKPTDGHFFDINSNSTDEVTKVVLEEMVTRDKTKRVTNSDPVSTVDGKPQIEFSDYNVHARAEFRATQRSFQLAKDCNLIFWISAEDGAMGLLKEEAEAKGMVYRDGRCNIYFRTIENGEIVLRGKHLPLDIDRFESLKLGKRLVENGGKTLGVLETVEDLRVQPIGFNLENMDQWVEECRKMIPEFEDFWELFNKGGDLKQQAEMKYEVEKAKKIAKGNNYVFQTELERRGIRINENGIHGSGYLGQQNNGAKEFKIEMKDGQYFTEPVMDTQGNLICPVCGVKVSAADAKCGTCGIGLNKLE